MADNAKPPGRRHRRRRFLFFCVYVVAYSVLRLTGEVVSQTAQIQVERQSALEYVVGVDPTLPLWRRQVYRAFFSPCMVVEEEVHRYAGGGGGGDLIRDIGDFFRDLLNF